MATCPNCGGVRQGFVLGEKLQASTDASLAGAQTKCTARVLLVLEHSCGWWVEVRYAEGDPGYVEMVPGGANWRSG